MDVDMALRRLCFGCAKVEERRWFIILSNSYNDFLAGYYDEGDQGEIDRSAGLPSSCM
jgi:hypothetical protein